MPLPRSVVSSVAIALVVAGVAARAAGEAQYRTAPPTRIAFEVFKKLYDRDAVLVLDVRAAESYRNGHVPGAILLPLGEVLSKVEELKKEKRAIVAYCA